MIISAPFICWLQYSDAKILRRKNFASISLFRISSYISCNSLKINKSGIRCIGTISDRIFERSCTNASARISLCPKATRNQEVFTQRFAEVREKNDDGSHFHLKMKKTWEKCLSATQSLDASIKYQMEEYAAVLCMHEFDHLLYPKRITNGLAYLYNYFSGEKPQYHHVKISEIKLTTSEKLFLNIEPSKKDRRHSYCLSGDTGAHGHFTCIR